jgi:hypothetical protein
LVLLLNIKGAAVDLDPINVEFWVVLGMLLAWVPANRVRNESGDLSRSTMDPSHAV